MKHPVHLLKKNGTIDVTNSLLILISFKLAKCQLILNYDFLWTYLYPANPPYFYLKLKNFYLQYYFIVVIIINLDL